MTNPKKGDWPPTFNTTKTIKLSASGTSRLRKNCNVFYSTDSRPGISGRPIRIRSCCTSQLAIFLNSLLCSFLHCFKRCSIDGSLSIEKFYSVFSYMF